MKEVLREILEDIRNIELEIERIWEEIKNLKRDVEGMKKEIKSLREIKWEILKEVVKDDGRKSRKSKKKV